MAPHCTCPGRFVFAAGFCRSQSSKGLKVPLYTTPAGAAHERVTLLTLDCTGLTKRAIVYASPTTYRPTLALSAVLPLPKRSYEMPNRGSTSFQFGTFLIASKW